MGKRGIVYDTQEIVLCSIWLRESVEWLSDVLCCSLVFCEEF